MWQKILNAVLFRKLRTDRLARRLEKELAGEMTEEFFKVLLYCMELFLLINPDFRRNIEGFQGRYLFNSKDGEVKLAVLYGNNRMTVKEKSLSDTDVTVSFKTYKDLCDFVTSPDPDIINGMLTQALSFDGNLNYLYKFGYMSRHMLSMLGVSPA